MKDRMMGMDSSEHPAWQDDPTEQEQERVEDERLADMLDRFVEADESGERLAWMTAGYDLTCREAILEAANRLRARQREEGDDYDELLSRAVELRHSDSASEEEVREWAEKLTRDILAAEDAGRLAGEDATPQREDEGRD